MKRGRDDEAPPRIWELYNNAIIILLIIYDTNNKHTNNNISIIIANNDSSGTRLCALIGVPWRGFSFSTFSTGWFVLKRYVCTGAESAKTSETPGDTYEGTQTTAWWELYNITGIWSWYHRDLLVIWFIVYWGPPQWIRKTTAIKAKRHETNYNWN